MRFPTAMGFPHALSRKLTATHLMSIGVMSSVVSFVGQNALCTSSFSSLCILKRQGQSEEWKQFRSGTCVLSGPPACEKIMRILGYFFNVPV